MVLSPEARVGTIAIIGILMIVMVVVFLGGLHLGPRGHRLLIKLEDAHGLERGSAVRMSGVKVGEVSDLKLTEEGKALVIVMLHRGIELWDTSRAEIKKGGLLGEYFISITPVFRRHAQRVTDDTVMQGEIEPQLEDLIPQAHDVLNELKEISANFNSLTKDKQIFVAIKQTVLDVRQTAAAMRTIVADTRLPTAIHSSAMNMQTATAFGVTAARNIAAATKELDHVNRIVSNLESITGENREAIRATLAGLQTTAKNVSAVSETVKWLISDSGAKDNLAQAVVALSAAARNLEQTSAQVRKLTADETVQKDLKDSLTTLHKTLANLEVTTASFKQIVTDQQLQADVKDTMRNVKATTDNTKTASEKVNQVLDEAKSAAEKVNKVIDKVTKPVGGLFNLQVTPDVSSRYFLSPADRLFTDFTLRVSRPGDNFLSLGMHDIGESNKLILQTGILRDPLTYRFGIYRSTVGLGTDLRLGSVGLLALDAFSPNHPQVNAWTGWRLSDRFRLMLGVEDLTHRRIGGFGFNYSR